MKVCIRIRYSKPDTATLRFLFKMKSYQIMNGRDFNGSKSFVIAFHQQRQQR